VSCDSIPAPRQGIGNATGELEPWMFKIFCRFTDVSGMARWAKAWTAIAALAAGLVLSAGAPAQADLLGGPTELVDDTVDAGASLIVDADDGITEVLDQAVGGTGAAIDEVVETVADVVVDTTDSVTDVVASPEEELGDVPADAAADDPPTTETTAPVVAGTPPTAPGDGGSAFEPVEDSAAVAPAGTWTAPAAPQPDLIASAVPGRGDDWLVVLAVLGSAGGLSDLASLDPVVVGPAMDATLYGRLLAWLSAAGSGLGALAGQLLGLDILLRALLSAGSGLVAPISMFGAMLVRAMWTSRVARPAPG
jgi:hypothetical protein